MSFSTLDRESLDESRAGLLGGLFNLEKYRQSRRSFLSSHAPFALLFLVGCGLSFMVGKTWRPKNTLLLEQEPNSHLHLTQYNSSVISPSIFHGEPSPELDEAWRNLAKLNYLRAQKEDLSKTGSNTNGIKYSEKSGGGYMATLEAVFHIHCLDEIRKSLFYHYEYYKDDPIFHEPMFSPEYRLDNCIEILRQVLMCNADESIIPFYWIKDYPIPLPNWNTWHMCRNYDDLMQWTEEQKVEGPNSWEELRAEAEYEFPAVPEPEDHPSPRSD